MRTLEAFHTIRFSTVLEIGSHDHNRSKRVYQSTRHGFAGGVFKWDYFHAGNAVFLTVYHDNKYIIQSLHDDHINIEIKIFLNRDPFRRFYMKAKRVT